jgi:hypothetical protein
VNGGNIFKHDVVDIVNGVVSDRTDASTAALVAGNVLNIDVATVAFD